MALAAKSLYSVKARDVVPEWLIEMSECGRFAGAKRFGYSEGDSSILKIPSFRSYSMQLCQG